MLRFLAGAGSALLLTAAGFFIWTGLAQDERDPVPDAPAAAAAEPGAPARPARPPSADERTKEQRRFARADRDDDGRITLAEMLYPRQRPFQRLDTNGDGRLSFEEWAVRTRTKFGEADRNRDQILDRTEYAATAPRPRPPSRQKACAC
jgi:hypothetical protein